MSKPNDDEANLSPEEIKAKKAAEKEARRLAFAATNPSAKTVYEKPVAKKAKGVITQNQNDDAAPPAPPPAAPPLAAPVEDDEKAKKAAEKEARRLAFAAVNPGVKTVYEKPAAKKSNNNTNNDDAVSTSTDAAPSTTNSKPTDSGDADDEKARKAAEKERRRLQFAATNPDKATTYEKGGKTKSQQQPTAEGEQQQQRSEPATSVTSEAFVEETPRIKIENWARPESIANLRAFCIGAPLGSNSNPLLFTNTESNNNNIHPRVASLGALLSSRSIVGSNARLLAVLDAVGMAACSFVEAHAVAGDMRLLQSLSAYLRQNLKFLESCRSFTTGMRQVTDRLMRELGTAELSVKSLTNVFNEHRTELQDAVVDTAAGAAKLISEDDIVLTYGRSSAIEMALCALCRDPNAPKFSIIVVDSAPHFEGRALLQRLRDAGAAALSYCMLDAVVMATHKATKVFVGASAMMPNGQVLSRAGTAMVTIAAKYTRTPVFCVCESYKFTANMWQGSSNNHSHGLNSDGSVIRNMMHNNSNNNQRSSFEQSAAFNNPYLPSRQQQSLMSFSGGGAAEYSSGGDGGGAANSSSRRRKDNNSNNFGGNTTSCNNFSSYDLTPPGAIQFVVSEHEVHEPTAIAAVVRLRTE